MLKNMLYLNKMQYPPDITDLLKELEIASGNWRFQLRSTLYWAMKEYDLHTIEEPILYPIKGINWIHLFYQEAVYHPGFEEYRLSIRAQGNKDTLPYPLN